MLVQQYNMYYLQQRKVCYVKGFFNSISFFRVLVRYPEVMDSLTVFLKNTPLSSCLIIDTLNSLQNTMTCLPRTFKKTLLIQ